MSEDDTFANARRRGHSRTSSRTKTANTIDIPSVANRSNLFDDSNPVRPTSGISPYTPIKSLLSSPLKSSGFSSRRPMPSSTPLDEGMIQPPLFSGASDVHSTTERSHIQRKTNASTNNSYSKKSNLQTPKPKDKTLFSKIYARSAFGTRRPTPEVSHSINRTRTPLQKTGHIHSNTTQAANDDSLDSPYMQIALGRIINRDQEIKRLLASFLSLLALKLVDALIRLAIVQMTIKGSGSSSFYNDSKWSRIFKYTHYIFYGFIVLNMLIATVRLLKPQDKCLDLPLTDRQRKILGLPALTSKDEYDSEGDINMENDNDRRPVIDMADHTVLEDDTILKNFAKMDLSSSQEASEQAHLAEEARQIEQMPISPEKVRRRILLSTQSVRKHPSGNFSFYSSADHPQRTDQSFYSYTGDTTY